MKNPVLLDSNLLLLLIVGTVSLDYLSKHKNLRNQCTADDYEILIIQLEDYSEIIVTPNTLTETSNLSRQIGDPARQELTEALRSFIQSRQELGIASVEAARRLEYAKLGLTDAVLLEIAGLKRQGLFPTLLTADLDLAVAAELHGYSV